MKAIASKSYLKCIVNCCIVATLTVTIMSCECISSEENVSLLVFPGTVDRDCNSLLKEFRGSSNKIAYTCPGEQVTICWSSTAIQSLTLKVNGSSESVSTSGTKVIDVSGDTDIQLVPNGAKCAGAKSFHVEVIDGPTPTNWDGRWTSQCGKLSFTIDEAFMSEKIIARDIRAKWQPIITVTDYEKNTYPYTCSTPPFLVGEHQEEGFGFAIDQPYVSVTFGRHLKAVGHWNFLWKANCGQDFVCNPAAVFPFEVTLDCP